jgi:hypothetical protein
LTSTNIGGRVGLECPTLRAVLTATTDARSSGGSLRQTVQAALVTKDFRPSTRRQYLIGLRAFMDPDTDSLCVADLNEILLTVSNQNTRRTTIIALKACVDHPAVEALRVPAAIPRDYKLPDESTRRLALITCPHETRLLLAMYGGLRLGELVGARWLPATVAGVLRSVALDREARGSSGGEDCSVGEELSRR